MSAPLEQSLRDALSHRAAQLSPDSIARLRAIDYHPRQRRLRKLPTIGAVGAAGTAAVIAVVVSLSSGAAPAFAGWQATPTTPTPGQLAQAAAACGQGLGSPVLTDARGPYTASIYSESNTSDLCLTGNSVSMSASSTTAGPVSVAAGEIQFLGGGTRDATGNALTLADGRTGAGVTAVTIELSDGSTVQATVEGGWYLAWWPGGLTATNAQITTASATSTVAFPSTTTLPACPTAATQCAIGSGGSAPHGGPGRGPGASGGSSQSGAGGLATGSSQSAAGGQSTSGGDGTSSSGGAALGGGGPGLGSSRSTTADHAGTNSSQ